MEVVPPQEFSCLAMVFPNFKGLLGKKGDTGAPVPSQPFYWPKTAGFLHSHQRLNDKTLVPVNLGDRTKTYGLKN
jgi:hypothetical protein